MYLTVLKEMDDAKKNMLWSILKEEYNQVHDRDLVLRNIYICI